MASTLFFLPQLLRVTISRDSSGLSIAYALLNLTSATHQLALGAGYIGFADEELIRGGFVWSLPQNVTDWVNLAQLLTFWFDTLALYVCICELWGPTLSSHVYHDTNTHLACI